MAKIVRIPLVMANGAKATDMKSLIANFDAESVARYFLEGKLVKWLEARYYDEEAAAIAALGRDDPELARKLCEVFGVEYSGAEFDKEEVLRRAERLTRLRQLTEDEEILRNTDAVAFDQAELAALYSAGVQKIYLCEGEFVIPEDKQELEYVVLGVATAKGIPSQQQPNVESKDDTAEQYSAALLQAESLQTPELSLCTTAATVTRSILKSIGFNMK